MSDARSRRLVLRSFGKDRMEKRVAPPPPCGRSRCAHAQRARWRRRSTLLLILSVTSTIALASARRSAGQELDDRAAPSVEATQFVLPGDAGRAESADSSTDSVVLEQPESLLPLRPPPTEPLPEPPPSVEFSDQRFDQYLLVTPRQMPNGYAGRSGVQPVDCQQDSHFVPVPDRWRLGFPVWDRYGADHAVLAGGDPFEEDAPYARGKILNPFNQNLLKGDYPIIGQHTFLNVTVTNFMSNEYREVPTPTTPFESTEDPFQEEFFGDPSQYFFKNDLKLSFDLNHGDAGFKPFDWRIKLTPVFDINYLDVEELGIVSPDVRQGTTRYRTFIALEEAFFEAKLADTSPHYDFLSMRLGSQPFVSDFRGFVFADINRGARFFGTRNANRDQYNVIVLDQREKETNSELNSYEDRHQTVAIANYFRQDFIWPGYTAQVSVHYNRDRPDFKFDRNSFLVRPDPAGVFEPHEVNAVYFGWTGDGHINRYNINHAFYWVVGRDDLNPLAGHAVSIDAQMAAIEFSYDRDWMRFRTSFFYASGDDDINDDRGRGFDTILDVPNFVGGEFSYWNRQAIRLFGVNLVDRFSLVPHLRSSKIQGQANFVNPGLFIFNVGNDMELTPRLRLIGNANWLWFEDTGVIEQFVFQSGIHQHIGTDLSLGTEYRPNLNDNLIFISGVSTLLPGDGFKDIYNPIAGSVDPLYTAFVDMVATF